MHRFSPQVALFVVFMLLCSSMPVFAQGPVPATVAATVVVPTPSQFAEPPAFTRRSLKGTLFGAGIYAGVAFILRMLIYIP